MIQRLPVALDLRGRRVLVVGAGQVAARKVSPLIEAGAQVEVVAPSLDSHMENLLAEGNLVAHQRPFAPEDLAGVWLVYALTDSPDLNARVAELCEERGIWCLVGGASQESPVWSLAHRRRGDELVAVSGGGNPRRALALLNRITGVLGWD
ncbi:precorrin-2 dehydrogenase/sirohydrochlorin ferrochelatase family protein [Rothia nasimurium]|uniref:precorrin-2 dehydrogenase/sirohydrochlorin ferrochelatase family protein n=1 Tax=Rothia nasimurium TaxID=85336 RepID=UPI001F42D9AA|nr:bifunctional precorrin-2 dehydrogenase/sirohydrochlorin ferrochelatase [Rothia nasimurium]